MVANTRAEGGGTTAPPKPPKQVNNNTPSETSQPGSVQQPVYHPVNELTIDSVVGQRAAKFDMPTIEKHPYTVAQTISSGIPTQHLDQIATAIREGGDYVMASDSFAGVPGALIEARIKALAIRDPEDRARALALLDAMRAAPLEQQQALWPILQGQLWNPGLPGVDPTRVQLPNTEAGFQTALAIKQLFPGAAFEIGVDGGGGEGFFGWLGEVRANYAAGLDTWGDMVSRASQRVHEQGVWESVKDVALSEGHTAMAVAGAAFKGVAHDLPLGIAKAVLPQGMEATAQDYIDSAYEVVTNDLNMAGRLVLTAGAAPEWAYLLATSRGQQEGESAWEQFRRLTRVTGPDNPLVVISADIGGFDLEDPAFQEIRGPANEIADTTGSIILLKGLTAGKAGRATPAEFAEPKGYSPGGRLGRSIYEGNLKPVVDYVEGRTGSRFISDINKVKEASIKAGETAEQFRGRLKATFPKMANSTAEALSREWRTNGLDEFKRIYIEHVGRAAESRPGALRALVDERRAVENRTAEAQAAMGEDLSAVRAAVNTVKADTTEGTASVGFTPKSVNDYMTEIQGDFNKIESDGNGVFHVNHTGVGGKVGRTYFYVKDGLVQGYRAIDMNGKVLSVVARDARRMGIGTKMTLAHWQNMTLADVIDSINRQSSMTEYAKEMNIRAAEIKFGDGDPLGAAGQRLTGLRLRAQELDSLLAEEANIEPIWEWTKRSRMSQILNRTPTTSTGRFIQAVYDRSHLHAEGLVNDAPRTDYFYEPFSRPDWTDVNSKAARNLLQRARVPEPVIRQLEGEIVRLITRRDFERWNGRVADALQAAAEKAARHGEIDAAVLQDITGTLRNPVYEDMPYRHEVDPVTGIARPRGILEYPHEPGSIPRPAPAMPSDFPNGRVRLPNAERLIDARSTVRQWAADQRAAGNLREAIATGESKVKAIAHRAAVLPYDVTKAAFAVQTMVFKAPVLVTRLPAMLFRITIEQGLRNMAFGRKPLLINTGILGDRFRATALGDALFGRDGLFPKTQKLGDLPVGEVGDILSETHEVFNRTSTPINLEPYLKDQSKLALEPTVQSQVINSRLDAFAGIYEDSVTRYLTTHTVEQTIEHIKTDGEAALWFDRQMRPEIEATLGKKYGLDGPEADWDGAMTEWLDSVDKYIDETAGGNPALRRAMGTLHWPGEGTQASTLAGHTGREFAQDRYTQLSHDLENVTEAINSHLSGENPMPESLLDEMFADREQIHAQMKELERVTTPQKYVDMTNRRAVRARLKADINDGTYKLPPSVTVKGGYKNSVPYVKTPWESVNTLIDGYSKVVYTPFRGLSWADVRLTRGSLYYQELESNFLRLRDAGWEPKRAMEVAQHRAALKTRDIMYDLSARTSAQNAVRNIYWFAPAYQEAIATWLIKAPSRAYWPVGLAGLLNISHQTMALFKDIGVIQTHEVRGQKQDIVVIPGVSGLIEKVTHGVGAVTGIETLKDVRVGDIVFGKPSGINMVTSNLPGMTPIPSQALAKMTEKYGGIFKVLSNILLPYGLDTSWLPAPLGYFYEAITGSKPPFGSLSPQFSQANYDRAYDASLQDAYVTMVHDHIKIPRVEDFADYKDENGRPALTREAELAWTKAYQEYWDELEHRAQSTFMGNAWVRALGSSASPLMLYPSSPERQAYEEFFSQHVIPAGWDKDGTLSDAQKDIIAQYVSKHPDSLAFTMSPIASGEATKQLPWQSTEDEAFYDKLRTGELRYLSPEDYLVKLQAIESLKHYRERQAAALAGAGTTAPQRLKNYYKVSQTVLANQDEFKRYLSLNSDVDKYLKDSRGEWEQKYGYPVRAYAVERQAELLRLLKLSAPFFAGAGGIRDTDYRHVVAAVGELYSKTGVFGEPKGAMEKGMAWYFNNVINPYMEAIGPILEHARNVTAEGPSAGELYSKASEITKAWSQREFIGPDGKKYPSPEVFFWGNQTEGERAKAIASWTTKNPSWLTPFQLRKVGFDGSAEMQDYFKFYDKTYSQFYNYVDQNDVSSASKEYDSLVQQRHDILFREAEKRGPKFVKMFQLSEAPPLERLNVTKYGASLGTPNKNWHYMTNAVENIVSEANAAGVSIKGYSEKILADKIHLESVIERLRDPANPDYDRDFDRLWTQLSRTFSDQTEGYIMYEAILFGQFEKAYINPDMNNIYRTYKRKAA